jgi:hypothetical protein
MNKIKINIYVEDSGNYEKRKKTLKLFSRD